MKTYKIDSEKATSLRKQLLWSQVAILAGMFLTFFSIAANAFPAAAFLGILTGAAAIWGTIAYWRSLWNLWEWPGIALGIGVAVGTVILNTIAPLIGMVANFAFFVYVYMQLGKQSVEAVKVHKREVFSE